MLDVCLVNRSVAPLLGEVLSDQSVCIFIGASLAAVVGISEVDGHSESSF